MTISLKFRIQNLVKTVLHVITLIGLVIVGNILPSYLVYRIIYPHHNASNVSGGLLLATSFVSFLWLVGKLSRVTKQYKTLLDKTKKNQSND